MTQQLPRDFPHQTRPHRIYAAITNHCNRTCPWCSMYSSPSGSSYMSEEKFRSILPNVGPFEMQLEGGEPTTHPLFWKFVNISLNQSDCTRLILCTNGTHLPRTQVRLAKWLSMLGQNYTIKVSINHHLLEHDPKLLLLLKLLSIELPLSETQRTLVINVRLRKGVANDDQAVRQLIENEGLLPWSNIFFLQKYGLASDQDSWDEPFIVGQNFTLVNPDAKTYGSDLVKRSEAMKILP